MKKILVVILMAVFSNSYGESFSIKVTESTPIYKQAIVQIPHTTYEEQQVQVPYSCNNSKNDKNSIGLDTIIGSIAGVVIGNQIGSGSGRDAAKIIGGISGGYIANNNREDETCYRMEFRNRPVTTYRSETKERLIGYKNCGFLGNKKICKNAKSEMIHIYLNY